MIGRLPLLTVVAVLCLVPAPAPKDLDVGIPPGTPASWGQRFPAITPRGGPLFPITGPGKKAQPKPGLKPGEKDNRTVVKSTTVDMDVHIATSFGVVRILTWDLAGHLTWVSRGSTGGRKKPVTGRGAGGKGAKLPYVTDGLYWANMASLLRWMLHPQQISEKELIAHLVEVGEPLIEVLNNSVSEKSLVPMSDKIRKMVSASPGGTKPLDGKTPRATMLKRFLAEELVSAYPFDPEGGFGGRFFLFADEVEPYLIEYAEQHPGTFLRRNAVSAVGRYRTTAAMRSLGTLAAKAKDPVILMRALAAVGANRGMPDRAPLLERLKSAKDPVEKAALIVAAGRMGMREAVPYLIKIGGKSRDPDLVMAAVAALVRIDHVPGEKTVEKFAARLVKAAASKPDRYRVKTRSAPKADFPDTAKTRGQIIHQLGLLLRARVASKKKDVAKRQVLALLSQPKKAPPGRRGAPPPRRGRRVRVSRNYQNASMRTVYPPVQLLFVEALRRLGKEGIEGLERIAKDPTVDPVLRGHALSQLPWASRGAIASAILADKSATVEAKIYAIEVVANDGAKDLEKIARSLLEEWGKAKAGANRGELRYLWKQALAALSKRGLAKDEDLIPLLKFAEARKLDNESLKQRVRTMIERLVGDAADGLAPITTVKRVNALFDFILSSGLNPRFKPEDRKARLAEVMKRLKALKGHRADVRFKRSVAADLVSYLIGFRMGMGLRERTEFKPVVMLEEELLLALGKTKTKKAGDAIQSFVRDHSASPVVAHAALALGMVGRKEYAAALLPLLSVEDGFVRFCAYESLRHLTGHDHFADWMYGDAVARKLAADKYAKLVGK